jgi:AcrR family transcriptional regulator
MASRKRPSVRPQPEAGDPADQPTGEARRARYGSGVTARGRRTRETLVRAARLVFERDGYLDARIADIAATAKMSHGTFYTYFDSKEAAFLEVLKEVASEVVQAVGHADDDVPGDVVGNIERSNTRYLDMYRRNSRMYVLMEQVAMIDDTVGHVRARAREVHVQRVAARIRLQQQRGVADPTVDAEVCAAALVSMLSNFAYWWIGMGAPYNEEAVIATLTRAWVSTVGIDTGHQAVAATP